MVINRASTQIQSFTLSDNYALMLPATKELLITYSQDDKIVLEKRKNDVTIDANTIKFNLTQEESNLFKGGILGVAQIRFLLEDGTCKSTDKIYFEVYDVLNDEVLK